MFAKDHLCVKKIVVPGARCPRLLEEAMRLHQTHAFEEVIVHVGVNYMHNPDYCNFSASEEIKNLLSALKFQFGCRITWSPILPFVASDEQSYENRDAPLSDHTLEMMRSSSFINNEVYQHCSRNMIDSMLCPEFLMDPFDPYPNKFLLAKDGTHLNRRGIVAMEHALAEHISFKFKTF